MQKGVLALFPDRMQTENAEDFGRMSFLSFSLFFNQRCGNDIANFQNSFFFFFLIIPFTSQRASET